MSFIVVIPARYASTRFPGKPLAPLGNKPLIRHVWEKAADSGAVRVVIATDDERVRSTCKAFGAEVAMTGDRHRSGTERIAELSRTLGFAEDTVVVNLQGDEPLIPPRVIAQVAADLAAHEASADAATLCEPIEAPAAVFEPSVVKVVCDNAGFALYFSRAPIPWDRRRFPDSPPDAGGARRYLRHVGIYAYRAAYLQRYVSLPQCDAEIAESLEQLRILHYGGRIHVTEAVEPTGPGVDTPADLERVRRLLQAGSGQS